MREHASTTPLNRLKKHWKRTKAAGVHCFFFFFFFFWYLGASCCLALSSFFISLLAMRAHASMTPRNTLQMHWKWTKTTDNHFFFFCSLGHASCCCLTSFVLFFFFSRPFEHMGARHHAAHCESTGNR
ncbi:hypothetical protein BC940DRAFT_76592 [Gongronella butleri]|nr:hypothetical protein BC940DRAFT_76592 [Gongronella butleri]